MTARVSILLKSRTSLTCFRACFLVGLRTYQHAGTTYFIDFMTIAECVNGLPRDAGYSVRFKKSAPIPAKWREWEHRLDICRVTRGAHIECI